MARVVMVLGYELKILRHVDDNVKDIAQFIARDARRRIHVRTGALRRSVSVKRRGIAKYRVVIGTDHWAYYEYGTKPHRIRAVRKKVLYSPYARNGFLGKEVMHPGNRAFAPMRTAFRAAAARY